MPYTIQIPTARDILERAEQLLRSPLPHDWSDCEYNHGPYCVLCACAHATTTLSDELETPVGASDGALRLAAAYCDSADPERLEDAIASVEHALRMIGG